jgi:predicted alpha/beta hydrolase family esterase
MKGLSGLRVLTLPGWQGSGPAHWQSRWEALHGFHRVEQHDEWQPRRGDWMARLEEVLLEEGARPERPDPAAAWVGMPTQPHRPTLLVAHGLGCHLVAAWAAHSRHTGRVAGALLVAPPDTGRDDLPPQVQGWRSAVMARLPFPTAVVASTDDPWASLASTGRLAQAWGASLVVAGAGGHLNAESNLGDWPAGLAWLQALAGEAAG